MHTPKNINIFILIYAGSQNLSLHVGVESYSSFSDNFSSGTSRHEHHNSHDSYSTSLEYRDTWKKLLEVFMLI